MTEQIRRHWDTLPEEDRQALLDVLIEEGMLDTLMFVTPLGEQYIREGANALPDLSPKLSYRRLTNGHSFSVITVRHLVNEDAIELYLVSALNEERIVHYDSSVALLVSETGEVVGVRIEGVPVNGEPESVR